MKICIVTTGDIFSSGTIKGATGLAVAFEKKGLEVSLILIDTKNNRDRVKLECPHIEVIWCPATNFLKEIFIKNDIISNNGFEFIYVISFGIRNFVYKMFNKKVFVSILEHSELPSSIPSSNRVRWMSNLILEKISLLFFSGHVCNSKYLFNEFNRRNKGIKSLYSTYAYSSDLVRINYNLSKKLSKKYEGKKVVCYMGTLVENYGILDIINEINHLKSINPNFILLIIGGGKDKEKMLTHIDKKGLSQYVDVANYVSEEDLYTYFYNSNAFVMPLRNTIQDRARSPSKVFMYMHFNKPIITTKLGESVEIFSDYEFYYDPDEEGSMALTMQKALFLSDNWNPKWDAKNHTWDDRAVNRIDWLEKNWLKAK